MEAFLKQVLVPRSPSLAVGAPRPRVLPLIGEVLSVCGARIARLFVAETEALVDSEPTVEGERAADQNHDEVLVPLRRAGPEEPPSIDLLRCFA